MKLSPVQEEFDRISADLRKDPALARARAILTQVQAAVKDLQDTGMRASLTVRPGQYEAARPKENTIANGVMQVDDIKVDFSIAGQSEYLAFNWFMGAVDLGTKWISNNTSGLKDSVRTMLLQIKAKNDILSEFNAGQGGVSRLASDKPAFPKLNA